MAASSEFQHELLRMDPSVLHKRFVNLAKMLHHNGYNTERLEYWIELGPVALLKHLARSRPIELVEQEEEHEVDVDGDTRMSSASSSSGTSLTKHKAKSGGGSGSGKKSSDKAIKKAAKKAAKKSAKQAAKAKVAKEEAKAAKATKKKTKSNKSSSASSVVAYRGKDAPQPTRLVDWTDEQQLAHELAASFERDLTIVLPARMPPPSQPRPAESESKDDTKSSSTLATGRARHAETVVLFSKSAKVGKPTAKLLGTILMRPRWRKTCFLVISQRGFTSPSLYTSTADMVDRVRVFTHYQLSFDVTCHRDYSFAHVLMTHSEQVERLHKLHGLVPGDHQDMVRLPRLCLYTDPTVNHGDFRARDVVKIIVPGVHDEYRYI